MWRNIPAAVAGFIVWWLVATVLDILLRHTLPGYAQAEPALAFTLNMEIARLALAVAASLAAGAATRAIAPASVWAPWATGLLLLALFLPVHIHIGARLPLWYHLTFLLTLAPLIALGARLRRPPPRPASAAPA
jgi:hypothetical protein